MSTRLVAWLAVVLTALALVPAGAHLFVLPNKMNLVEENYFVAQSVYRGWAWFGVVLIGALAANAAFAYCTRKDQNISYLATAAAISIGATLAIFFTFVFPANQATNDWTVAPVNWTQLRLQWEFGHAANALITFLGFCCVSWAAVLLKEK
jgi:hypothetical protein